MTLCCPTKNAEKKKFRRTLFLIMNTAKGMNGSAVRTTVAS